MDLASPSIINGLWKLNMAKLNQIIAVEKGDKSSHHSEISNLYKAVQKPELFNGFSKVYEKREESDENLPAEEHRVQFSSQNVLERAERSFSNLMEITARKDWTNCTAKGSVTVDDKVIVKDAPVSYLLFLEKQITDLRTFVAAMPTLDGAYSWKRDANDGLYKTDRVPTHRTKKVQKAIVLYDATPEHPAQTQLITEDVLAGHWYTVRLSGALPPTEKTATLERIDKLIKAIKHAREAANIQEEVKPPAVGNEIFNYILGSQAKGIKS